MNLTPSERAAMVKDIEALAKKYERTSDMFEGHASMRDNYSALAAFKRSQRTRERLTR